MQIAGCMVLVGEWLDGCTVVLLFGGVAGPSLPHSSSSSKGCPSKESEIDHTRLVFISSVDLVDGTGRAKIGAVFMAAGRPVLPSLPLPTAAPAPVSRRAFELAVQTGLWAGQ